jgi:glycosyltransferase involved in cell wall biosynthesis
MIRICMITYDQLDKKNPRADLIRFRCLGEALERRSIEVVYVTSNERRRFEEKSREGSRVYKLPLLTSTHLVQLPCFYFFLVFFLLRVKELDSLDIIFVNSVFSVPAALFLKWLKGGRVQFDLMGILSEERFPGRPHRFWFRLEKKALRTLEKFLLSQVDFITTISEQHKRVIVERITRPVYVIRDGILEDIWRQSAKGTRDLRQSSEIVLIFVGHLSHFRLDPLFDILPGLMVEVPELHLQVLGVGPQLNRYKNLAQLLGLEQRVTFLGHLPHNKMFGFIAKADIAYSDNRFVLGFPMKLFDYMALGKAIVAEGTESVRELLTDRVHGLLYTNKSELKERILTLAKDGDLRRKLGETARRTMDQHTWEKRAEALVLIYKQSIPKMETT